MVTFTSRSTPGGNFARSGSLIPKHGRALRRMAPQAGPGSGSLASHGQRCSPQLLCFLTSVSSPRGPAGLNPGLHCSAAPSAEAVGQGIRVSTQSLRRAVL